MYTNSFFFGTGMFEFNHVLFLILSILVIVFGSILSIKYLKVETMHKILLGVGIVSESIKVISYIVLNEDSLGGYLPKTDLPFHLCSIQIIFFVILVLSKNEKIKHALHGFIIPTCLVGGGAALILATQSSRSMPIIGIQYFGFHSAIVTFAIYLLANKEIKFTIKDYFNTLIMLVVTLFIAIYINSVLYTANYELVDNVLVKTYENINFMYVVKAPQENLPYLNTNHGWGVYMIHYVLLGLFVVTLCYIKPIIDSMKNLKTKKCH